MTAENNHDIDEWMELMFEAKQAGIAIEKVKTFINQHNNILKAALYPSKIRNNVRKNEPLI
ncbi:hypothetical protein E2R51_07465 [Jeotgalibacillus sp. S-D1]|uniref:hypothetical protein n=1 Tax=Jeotgalibacillus sp. S-D1 TaxID=2552189 RepID=UPI001059643E|nr:hypothetical protein [Jeotgalibacillus sp. S-D1]TDL32520.1 hypothetical protein E2R51_07465 [Jeotgalibacillus sp. S-D1]